MLLVPVGALFFLYHGEILATLAWVIVYPITVTAIFKVLVDNQDVKKKERKLERD